MQDLASSLGKTKEQKKRCCAAGFGISGEVRGADSTSAIIHPYLFFPRKHFLLSHTLTNVLSQPLPIIRTFFGVFLSFELLLDVNMALVVVRRALPISICFNRTNFQQPPQMVRERGWYVVI